MRMSDWRRRIKVLPMDSWMESEDHDFFGIIFKETLEEYAEKGREIEPLLHRPGRYYLRPSHKGGTGLCWFELPNGRAFKASSKHFLYDLALLDVEHYNQRQVDALQAVVAQKLATPEQRKLLHLIWSQRTSRQVYRTACLERLVRLGR